MDDFSELQNCETVHVATIVVRYSFIIYITRTSLLLLLLLFILKLVFLVHVCSIVA